jgi:hypothetical protein
MSLPESFDLAGGLSIVTQAHAQATITPTVTLFARIAGGGFRQMDDSEYALALPDASTVVLTFPYELPEHPEVGAVRAQVWNGTVTVATAPSLSPAGDLLARGLQFYQRTYATATITIAGVEYECGGGGLKRERDLISGGWLDQYRVSFWVELVKFADANQPVPVPKRTSVTWQGLAYLLDDLALDATGATAMLHCVTPDE